MRGTHIVHLYNILVSLHFKLNGKVNFFLKNFGGHKSFLWISGVLKPEWAALFRLH